MDPTRLPKIMIHWKPEGRKKNEAVPGEPGKMEYIYSHEWKRSKNGQMEQSMASEYENRKASSDVLKRRRNRTDRTVGRPTSSIQDGVNKSVCKCWCLKVRPRTPAPCCLRCSEPRTAALTAAAGDLARCVPYSRSALGRSQAPCLLVVLRRRRYSLEKYLYCTIM